MNTLKELYLEASRVAKLIEGTDMRFYHCIRQGRSIFTTPPMFVDKPETYEFALAIVEGKPVFKGDVLYDENGNRYPIQKATLSNDVYYLNGCNIKKWSWSPPKPRTVMVEFDMDTVTKLKNVPENFYYNGVSLKVIADAFSKALEELKS